MRFRTTNLIALMVVALMATATKAAMADTLFWEASDQNGDMVMTAGYVENYYGDLVDQGIQVRVYNAPANTRFRVTVEGFQIGVLVTNDFGFGSFFKGRYAVPIGLDGRPAAPRVNTDDVLQVSNSKVGVSFVATFTPR